MKRFLIISLFVLFTALPIKIFAAGITEKYEALTNPLPSNELVCPTAVCELKDFFLLITRDLIQIIPIAAVVMVIVAGFKMVVSGGNEEKITEAKRMLFWAVIGLIIAFMSFSIVIIVQNLIGVK